MGDRGPGPSSGIVGCVTLRKSLTFSGFHFPKLKEGRLNCWCLGLVPQSTGSGS
jgi:hypothetical protein